MKQLNRKQPLLAVNGLTFICLIFIILFSSCNKDFPNTLRTEYPNDTANVSSKERKVLYILLDGVRGGALKTLNPPNLTQVVKKSIYAYDGLSDYQTNTLTNAGAWTNATTGVTSDKHKVLSENFSGNQISAYPSLFTRLKQAKPNLRTASIAASKVFNDNLAIDATTKANFENDDAKVKDAVIDELKRVDAAVVIGQFHSADLAGAANGYTDNTPAYTGAILQLDAYIGDIMTALQKRATFAQEDWMVVIASNKGGNIAIDPATAGLGAYSDPTRNNFVIFYNPRFVTQITPRPDANSFPYVGYGPRFISTLTSSGVATLSNTTIGNFGTTGSYTLMFKLKHDGPSATYPHFLGKRTPSSTSSVGWSFLLGSSGYQLDWGGSPRPSGGDIRDGIWHTIGFKIYNINGVRNLSLFTDGKKMSTNSINGRNIDNAVPFRLGTDVALFSYELTNLVIKDIVLLNVELSDEEFANNARIEFSVTNPFFANCIGWWPGNEATGTTITDMSGKGNNFTGNAAMQRTTFESLSPNISPSLTPASFRVVINNVDIPYQIYQWLGVIVQDSWQLNGKIWKPTFTDVRN